MQYPQRSPQHRCDELGDVVDAYLELLFKGSDKLGGKENAEERIEPASLSPWLSGEVLERSESTEPKSTEPDHQRRR